MKIKDWSTKGGSEEASVKAGDITEKETPAKMTIKEAAASKKLSKEKAKSEQTAGKEAVTKKVAQATYSKEVAATEAAKINMEKNEPAAVIDNYVNNANEAASDDDSKAGAARSGDRYNGWDY